MTIPLYRVLFTEQRGWQHLHGRIVHKKTHVSGNCCLYITKWVKSGATTSLLSQTLRGKKKRFRSSMGQFLKPCWRTRPQPWRVSDSMYKSSAWSNNIVLCIQSTMHCFIGIPPLPPSFFRLQDWRSLYWPLRSCHGPTCTMWLKVILKSPWSVQRSSNCSKEKNT